MDLDQSRENAKAMHLLWVEPAEGLPIVARVTAEGVLIYKCPGCNAEHGLAMKTPSAPAGQVWRWNGNVAKPTVNPSVMSHALADRPACQHFMVNGILEFLPMTTHPLRLQKVPMLPLE